MLEVESEFDAQLGPAPNGFEAQESSIYFRDIAPAVEFCCWVVLALAPFLRWVNGAAVTDDQFVMQVVLVSVAATGAIGLRLHSWRVVRKDCLPHSPASHLVESRIE
jgi:hypothetical protein